MAACYLRNGDVAAAENAARLGATMGAEVGSAMAEGAGRYFLGQLARFRGDYGQAIEDLQEMLRSGRATGMVFLEAVALCALGGVYADISEELIDQAAKHHAEALKLMEHPLGQVMGVMGWVEIASCALAAGNLAGAEDLFQKTLTQPTAAMYVMRPQALLGSAFVALARHDAKAATAWIEEARQYVEERRMQHFYPPLALAEAFVRASTGDSSTALKQFNRAEQLALQMGMRPVVLQARAGQAQVLAAMGRTAEAAAALQGARAMIDEIAGLFKDSKLRELFLASANRKLPAPA